MQTPSILVPTDGSEASERALSYATALGRQLNARLDVCYAVDYVTEPAVLATSQATGAPDLLQSEGRAALASAVRILDAADSNGTTHLLEGVPAGAIVARAKETGPIVVVVGTSGRRGLSRAILGSTAEAIVRDSPVPVIVISPNVRAPLAAPLKRIAVAIDGSAPSVLAAEAAGTLAVLAKAELDLCYVIDPEEISAAMRDDAVSLGTALLEAQAVRARALGATPRTHLLEGPVVSRLLDFAAAQDVSLIAMGTHGRRGIERLTFGSVAQAALFESPLPVLLTRAQPSAHAH